MELFCGFVVALFAVPIDLSSWFVAAIPRMVVSNCLASTLSLGMHVTQTSDSRSAILAAIAGMWDASTSLPEKAKSLKDLKVLLIAGRLKCARGALPYAFNMSKAAAEDKRMTSQSLAIVALLVSIVSLVVSFWTSFSPADIRVSVSSPQWILKAAGYKPLRTGKEEMQQRLMLKLTCSYSNVGARTGSIENIAVKFFSEDSNTKWLFYPYLAVDDAKLMSEGWDSLNWARGPFYSVAVPGKQTLALTYIFFPESDLPNFDNVKLTPHRFKVTVLSWAADETAWKEQQTFTINFDQDLIDEISKGVIFGIPSVEQQQRVRSIK